MINNQEYRFGSFIDVTEDMITEDPPLEHIPQLHDMSFEIQATGPAAEALSELVERNLPPDVKAAFRNARKARPDKSK